MKKSSLRSIVDRSIPVIVLAAAFAVPFSAMGAERTVLGELFTIPG